MYNRIGILGLLVFAAVFPGSARAVDVTVTNAWFRALPAGLPAGGYFSLHNAGATPEKLVGAKSAACGVLMLHQSTESGGMSRMNDVASVEVGAGATIAFAPGGYHLMCMHPSSAMAPGRQVTVTLLFADGARTDAVFAVKNAAGE